MCSAHSVCYNNHDMHTVDVSHPAQRCHLPGLLAAGCFFAGRQLTPPEPLPETEAIRPET